jgi:hypothetical protein
MEFSNRVASLVQYFALRLPNEEGTEIIEV